MAIRAKTSRATTINLTLAVLASLAALPSLSLWVKGEPGARLRGSCSSGSLLSSDAASYARVGSRCERGSRSGAKGIVLLPSIDRLVALLAVYTKERSLEDIVPSLGIVVVRSPVGTREITLSFAAESSDRMDRVAETARLVGGFTFTGTSRHFVQYRDAAAPFGYDAAELASTDAGLALYHDRFSQTYEPERRIELRALLLRLMPRSEPATKLEAGLRFIVAEPGLLGPALAHYFIRSSARRRRRVHRRVASAERVRRVPDPSLAAPRPRAPRADATARPRNPRHHLLRPRRARRGRRSRVPPTDRSPGVSTSSIPPGFCAPPGPRR